jgi:hypothetical protein
VAYFLFLEKTKGRLGDLEYKQKQADS